MTRAHLYPPHFAADQAGCPTCRLELVPHPDGGRWVCPSCKYERATMRATATTVSTRPQVAAVVKVMTETLEQIRPTGVTVETQHTTVEESDADETPAQSLAVSEFVSIDALATRWGLTQNGARSRLERHAVEIMRDPRGHLAAREADLAGRDWARRNAYGASNGHAPAERLPFKRLDAPPSAEPPRPVEPAPAATVSRGSPDLTRPPFAERLAADIAELEEVPARPAPADRPPAFAPLYGNDAGRVRRLLLALAKIRKLAGAYDAYPACAIAALAEYAIEAES